MEKQQKNKKEPSTTTRIPNNLFDKYQKIGEGNVRSGMEKTMNIYEFVEKDPSILLERELDHFSNLVKAFLPDNHYKHYVESRIPAFLVRFIRTGHIDINFLKKVREESSIEEFEEKK